jgi:1-acyl-sn-glycerol-3-phosphate acyltransferase
MSRLFVFLYSLYFWGILFLIGMVFFLVSVLLFLLTFLWDRQLRILHYYTCFWSAFTLAFNPKWKITVSGREHAVKGKPYIIVSNHQSGADVIVLFKLWLRYKWVAKKSLFRVPFIGWNMGLNRYISLERGKKNSMAKMFRDCKAVLDKGTSVMIFPEGTRSRDGHLQHFKSGAFHLAVETGLPLLPVVIEGTSAAIDRNGFLILRNKNIRATILPPVSPEEFAGMDPKDLAVLVHDRILDHLSLK